MKTAYDSHQNVAVKDRRDGDHRKGDTSRRSADAQHLDIIPSDPDRAHLPAVDACYLLELRLEELAEIITRLDENEPIVKACEDDFYGRIETVRKIMIEDGFLEPSQSPEDALVDALNSLQLG